MTLASPALAGTFGAGAGAEFLPSQGPRGTLATGCTSTSMVLSTALPAVVGVNALANRGDGIGFKIRIIGNAAGSSGKTEERYIIGNTGGTTPTITLDSTLSFTPAADDAYEFLSGRVFMLSAGTLAAGVWKYYDVLTNSLSGNLATTNLPATISTDFSAVALDELHVPYNRNPGEGFLGSLVATAAAAGTITGQATGGDAAVLLNEYRNFQIRIVQDTGAPTAVGQRRLISSHTAGPSAVYTLASNWTVTPSATATFVIENCNYLLVFSSAQGTVFTYNPTPLIIGSLATDTWNTAVFSPRGANMGAGCTSCQSFGLVPDAAKNARHSFIYSFRGGNVNTLDLLDIAGGATGAWTLGIGYGNASANFLFTTGACGVYAPAVQQGRHLYISNNGTQRFARFDLLNRTLEPWCWLRYAQGTSAVGERCAMTLFIDGSTELGFLITQRQGAPEIFQVAISR
ncbi:MAG: hypothetical protein HY743_10860 [Deltaproteobacteria bacterium]|nr:hypothetical protein [Deltaproteobacteria bacterium]